MTIVCASGQHSPPRSCSLSVYFLARSLVSTLHAVNPYRRVCRFGKRCSARDGATNFSADKTERENDVVPAYRAAVDLMASPLAPVTSSGTTTQCDDSGALAARLEVLLSVDLLPCIFASLELRECAVARVCKAWSCSWTRLLDDRRALNQVPCAPLSFKVTCPSALVPTPNGERLCIVTANYCYQYGVPPCVHITDKHMRLEHTIHDMLGGRADRTEGAVASNDALYLSEHDQNLESASHGGRVRRFSLVDFTMAHELTISQLEEWYRVHEQSEVDMQWWGMGPLALAPDRVLFAVVWTFHKTVHDVIALDPANLEPQFILPLPDEEHEITSMLVVGDTLCMAIETDGSLRLLSLDGAPIRSLQGDWMTPKWLCSTGLTDRLYLGSETDEDVLFPELMDQYNANCEETIWPGVLASKKVNVIALKDGKTLASYSYTDGDDDLCRFDGKLLHPERDESGCSLEPGRLVGLADVARVWK